MKAPSPEHVHGFPHSDVDFELSGAANGYDVVYGLVHADNMEPFGSYCKPNVSGWQVIILDPSQAMRGF